MSKPIRIQLSRKKGWRLPPNTVVVSRPSKWGNPFRIGDYMRIGDLDRKQTVFRCQWMRRIIWKPEDIDDALATGFTLVENREQAVQMFRKLMNASPWKVKSLRGKNLACWCPLDAPCHADTLLELANP